MTPEELAIKLGISAKSLRAWLRSRFPRPASQKGNSWSLTPQHVAAADGHFGGSTTPQVSRPASLRTSTSVVGTARSRSDEAYVIDLCDELLEEKGQRQHTFDWLVGDPGRSGACRRLPVDAYYQQRCLVVEYRERQHDEAVPFFDRRHTVSGVGRGEQRRIYDRRKEAEIPKRALRLLIITPMQLDANRQGRLRRNREHDLRMLKSLLAPAS
jgi:hypothetical protein